MFQPIEAISRYIALLQSSFFAVPPYTGSALYRYVVYVMPVHSQCVNTGQCREIQQIERRVTVNLYVPDDGHNRQKHVIHANTWCVYTRIVLTA
jgi:hypothetical protein